MHSSVSVKMAVLVAMLAITAVSGGRPIPNAEGGAEEGFFEGSEVPHVKDTLTSQFPQKDAHFPQTATPLFPQKDVQKPQKATPLFPQKDAHTLQTGTPLFVGNKNERTHAPTSALSPLRAQPVGVNAARRPTNSFVLQVNDNSYPLQGQFLSTGSQTVIRYKPLAVLTHPQMVSGSSYEYNPYSHSSTFLPSPIGSHSAGKPTNYFTSPNMEGVSQAVVPTNYFADGSVMPVSQSLPTPFEATGSAIPANPSISQGTSEGSLLTKQPTSSQHQGYDETFPTSLPTTSFIPSSGYRYTPAGTSYTPLKRDEKYPVAMPAMPVSPSATGYKPMVAAGFSFVPQTTSEEYVVAQPVTSNNPTAASGYVFPASPSTSSTPHQQHSGTYAVPTHSASLTPSYPSGSHTGVIPTTLFQPHVHAASTSVTSQPTSFVQGRPQGNYQIATNQPHFVSQASSQNIPTPYGSHFVYEQYQPYPQYPQYPRGSYTKNCNYPQYNKRCYN